MSAAPYLIVLHWVAWVALACDRLRLPAKRESIDRAASPANLPDRRRPRGVPRDRRARAARIRRRRIWVLARTGHPQPPLRRTVHLRAHQIHAGARWLLAGSPAVVDTRLSARRAKPDAHHGRHQSAWGARRPDQRADVRRPGAVQVPG